MDVEREAVVLRPMTRELCRRFYREFENDPAIYVDMSRFAPYVYDEAAVDRRFDAQQVPDRRAFLVMLGERPVGEVILKYIDWDKRECSLSIHMVNDSVKNKGYGTQAERLAVEFTSRCARRTWEEKTPQREGVDFEPLLWRLGQRMEVDGHGV